MRTIPEQQFKELKIQAIDIVLAYLSDDLITDNEEINEVLSTYGNFGIITQEECQNQIICIL